MRYSTSALFLIAAVSSTFVAAEVQPVALESLYRFEQWVEAHAKQYASDLQKMARLHIWLANDGK